MATITEGAYLGDAVKWEQADNYSREKVTVLSGENLAILEVVGKVTKSTPTTGTAGTNTGNGTCTSVTAGKQAKLGTYTLTCTAAATNGGTFKVVSPDGDALANATVGTAYTSEQLNFTLNDGATDFAVGDSFTIAVAAGSGKVVAYDQDAVDGSADAAGFMIAAVDASSADKEGVIISRDALVVTGNLVWPDDITDDEKTAAIAQLEALGIKAVSQA